MIDDEEYEGAEGGHKEGQESRKAAHAPTKPCLGFKSQAAPLSSAFAILSTCSQASACFRFIRGLKHDLHFPS